MAIPRLKERRLSDRRELTGLLPGKLTKDADSKEVICQPVDVSSHGLGILSEAHLREGDTLTLATQDQNIALTVSWLKPDFGKRDLYRFGLVTDDSSVDLKKIFIDAGCLR